jgi:glycosyltransferase involved in cell wall biosynthesis
MMHLFINALAATAGGGLTYIRNVLPYFASRSDLRVTVALSSDLRKEFRLGPNVGFVEVSVPVARRFWFEQSKLPDMIAGLQSDVLLSTGNFALWRSPVPQVLLSRNSIYTSSDFYRDLWSRHDYRTWIDTRLRAMLAKRSVRWADLTIAPSETFAAELTSWSGKNVIAIHHGFDQKSFTALSDPLPPGVVQKIRETEGAVRLLFVSHYNYYRNFETLIQSLPLLRNCFVKRSVKLLLTCHLSAGKNQGGYRSQSAANLVKRLDVSDVVVELGPIPYQQLHEVYACADVYVTPSYAETFSHPLVEAMSSGVPVVASDIAVHREICGDAAAYFPTFSPEKLAQTVEQVVSSPEATSRMATAGLVQASSFSWRRHAESMLEVCANLVHAVRPIEAGIVQKNPRPLL